LPEVSDFCFDLAGDEESDLISAALRVADLTGVIAARLPLLLWLT
jgi:hypothetical protein